MSSDTMFFVEMPETVAVAFKVLTGFYGIGLERKTALESDGYNYDTIQSCVNDLVEVFNKYA